MKFIVMSICLGFGSVSMAQSIQVCLPVLGTGMFKHTVFIMKGQTQYAAITLNHEVTNADLQDVQVMGQVASCNLQGIPAN